jgi:hypothetical protein
MPRSTATVPPAPTNQTQEVELDDGSPWKGRIPAVPRMRRSPTERWEDSIRNSTVSRLSQYVRPLGSPDDAITHLTLYAGPREGRRTVDPRVSASLPSAATTNWSFTTLQPLSPQIRTQYPPFAVAAGAAQRVTITTAAKATRARPIPKIRVTTQSESLLFRLLARAGREFVFVRRFGLVVAFLVLAGCGSNARSPASIDEQKGTYHGVGIGDRPKAIFSVFGRKPLSGTDEPVIPLKDDFVDIGGAPAISPPPRCKGNAPGTSGVSTLRYDHVSFLFCDARVFGFIVAVENARTMRGVAVGDDLSKVQQAYPGLSCGQAPYGEGLFGQRPSYPYCGGKLRARRWIWFGRDPVRSITLSVAALRT